MLTKYVCEDCGYLTHRADNYKRHLKKKLKCNVERKHKCECGYSTDDKSNFNKHFKNCKGPEQSKADSDKEIAENKTLLAATGNQRLEQASSSASNSSPSIVHSNNVQSIVDNSADSAASSQDILSQPLIGAPVPIIDQVGFFEFDNKKIRKTSETPQRVSVYDLIAAITDHDNKTASKSFSRMKEAYSEVSTFCRNFKFNGSGQRDTPVTNARGAVIIMNLLSGEKAAKFRLASADIIVRYLGGDETLIGEILRNQEIQEIAPDTNAVRLFAEDVNATKFYNTSLLAIESVTNVQEFRAPQFYFRHILGKWSHLHPTGRPQEVISADALSKVAVIKIGSMGVTERQMTHNKQFDRSELVDSCLTSSFTHVETKAKDYWRDRGELYEGLHEGKTVRDTELLLVRSQEDYKRHLAVVQQLCERFPYIPDKPQEDSTTLELSLAQEKSKQIEAEARKAEAEARKAQAEADVRKAEFEMLKYKIAHGLSIE